MRPDRLTLLISIVLVATFTGFLVFAWLTDKEEQTPPHLVVVTGTVRSEGNIYYLPFKLTNQGEQTAELVQILGELKVGEKVESGEQVVDFLSHHEEVEGAFVFHQDPGQGAVSVRVASYKLP